MSSLRRERLVSLVGAILAGIISSASVLFLLYCLEFPRSEYRARLDFFLYSAQGWPILAVLHLASLILGLALLWLSRQLSWLNTVGLAFGSLATLLVVWLGFIPPVIPEFTSTAQQAVGTSAVGVVLLLTWVLLQAIAGSSGAKRS
jgi:hypothetical protein